MFFQIWQRYVAPIPRIATPRMKISERRHSRVCKIPTTSAQIYLQFFRVIKIKLTAVLRSSGRSRLDPDAFVKLYTQNRQPWISGFPPWKSPPNSTIIGFGDTVAVSGMSSWIHSITLWPWRDQESLWRSRFGAFSGRAQRPESWG